MLQGDRDYVLCVLKNKQQQQKKSKGESQRKKARAKVRGFKLQVVYIVKGFGAGDCDGRAKAQGAATGVLKRS